MPRSNCLQMKLLMTGLALSCQAPAAELDLVSYKFDNLVDHLR